MVTMAGARGRGGNERNDMVPKRHPARCSVNPSGLSESSPTPRCSPEDFEALRSEPGCPGIHRACWWQKELETAFLTTCSLGLSATWHCLTSILAVVKKPESKVPCSRTHKVWEEVQKRCLPSIMIITTEKLMQARIESIVK